MRSASAAVLRRCATGVVRQRGVPPRLCGRDATGALLAQHQVLLQQGWGGAAGIRCLGQPRFFVAASLFARHAEEPRNQILRLTGAAKLRAQASADSEMLAELGAGDLVEAIGGNLEPAGGWLLVRSPLEDRIDVMSDKPLEYQDGWLAVAAPALEADFGTASPAPAPAEEAGGAAALALEKLLVPTDVQMGERVAARVLLETHPVLDALKKLPLFKDGLPNWMPVSVAELYAGRIAGVAKRGRFILQRPSGAMPERVASVPEKLIRPKARMRQTTIAGILGLGLSLVLGLGLHARKWVRGEPLDAGRFALEPLVGWTTLLVVFLTPVTILPCFIFTNSQASTLVVVVWMNMLLYNDLFSE